MTPSGIRFGTDPDTGLDFDAHYTVAGYSGVAFYLYGYALEWEPAEETFTLTCTTDHDHDESCDGYWTEPEEVERKDMVQAIMVGDDAIHIVDVSDLSLCHSYCSGCGQTGCTANEVEE